MSVEIEEKRYFVSLAYTGEGWKRKVLNMRPAQVCAVYESLKEKGMINKIKRELHPTKQDLKIHQISIAEYMEDK